MNQLDLPACRHRSGPIGDNLWSCSSPKIILPGQSFNGSDTTKSVTSEMCESQCPYVDHRFDPRFSLIAGELRLSPLNEPFRQRAGELTGVSPQQDLFAVGMLTAPRTVPVVNESVRQLRQAGFTEHVHLFAEPESPWQPMSDVEVHFSAERLGCWGNFRRAARYLLEHTQNPYILIFEDDILLSQDASLALQYAAQTISTSDLGYFSLYSSWNNVIGKSIRSGWQSMPVNAGTLGALAYCFSRESLEFALRHTPTADGHRFHDNDVVLSRLFGERNRHCYFHIPSLCAHAGNHNSTLGHDGLRDTEAIDFPPTTRRYHVRPSCVSVTADTSNVNSGQLCALTSLSPSHHRAEVTRRCIHSWKNAGMRVVSFNHPDEIPDLRNRYDIEFVPVTETTRQVFGRHYVSINTMLEWADRQHTQVLIINSDIELTLNKTALDRIRLLSVDGMAYFVRYNHDGDPRVARKEPYGIDAFMLHGQHAKLFPKSFMSMGRPAWDYWLPHEFSKRGLPLFAVEFPAALHCAHTQAWSQHDWHRCVLEFDRVSDILDDQRSYSSSVEKALRIRQSIELSSKQISRHPLHIQDWLRDLFREPSSKTFFELGSHDGTDTRWLASFPDVTVHAFEPDPRNQQPPLPNVVLNQMAVAERSGRCPFVLSGARLGSEWTASSSIKRPKNHLHRYPVSFRETIEVPCVSLDEYGRDRGIDMVDFIWADIQGAEGDMILGGRKLLSRTRYLYVEYSNDELYEGQISLEEILQLLPGFRVLELWPEDVLLINTEMS